MGFHGFWLVSPFFQGVSWILVGSPGFLCGFCFFLVFGFVVSYMIWKASVCHVEEKNQNIPAWTVSRRNDSIQACQHNKLQISVIREKFCKLRKLNGD